MGVHQDAHFLLLQYFLTGSYNRGRVLVVLILYNVFFLSSGVLCVSLKSKNFFKPLNPTVMKIFFLLLALSGIFNSSFAQKVHFSDTSNAWKVVLFDPDHAIAVDNYHFSGDSLYGYGFSSVASVIREDTTTHKVYAISSNYADHDTTEHLLYDFSMGMGDTIKTHFARHYVTAIDSIQVNGVWHKKWQLKGCWMDTSMHITEMLADYSVLEGIGSLYGPRFPDYPFFFEIGSQLVCFENKGSKPALSSSPSYYFNNTTSCTNSFGLGVHNLLQSSAQLSVYPNPVNAETSIYFPADFSGACTLYNITGCVVFKEQVNTGALKIGGQITSPGLYFYMATDYKTGSVVSGKLVKE